MRCFGLVDVVVVAAYSLSGIVCTSFASRHEPREPSVWEKPGHTGRSRRRSRKVVYRSRATARLTPQFGAAPARALSCLSKSFRAMPAGSSSADGAGLRCFELAAAELASFSVASAAATDPPATCSESDVCGTSQIAMSGSGSEGDFLLSPALTPAPSTHMSLDTGRSVGNRSRTRPNDVGGT